VDREAADAPKALTEDDKADPIVRLKSRRAEGALKLAKLLGVESIVSQMPRKPHTPCDLTKRKKLASSTVRNPQLLEL
jgi:hypothetical protein